MLFFPIDREVRFTKSKDSIDGETVLQRYALMMTWQMVFLGSKMCQQSGGGEGLATMNSIPGAVITLLDEVGQVTALWVSTSPFTK